LKPVKREDVDLIVYDFDGVMTDNRVYLDQEGVESVICNRADGLGIDMLRCAGISQIIVSTETNRVVLARARKLGLEALHGVADKRKALLDFCASHDYDPGRVVYVGNDLNDLEAMQTVGYPVSPADAHAVVRDVSCVVTSAAGGEGVVRELADALLRGRDDLPDTRLDEPARLGAQIREELADAARLRMAMVEDAQVVGRVDAIARVMAECLLSGGKVIFAGNGGSFADAQHLAAEFVGRFLRERPPLASLCLGTNPSTVTAVGNDYCFDDIFVRELRALGRKEDVLVALSTSGNSKNVIAAIEIAREIGLRVFALLGKGGGRIAKLVPSIVVPSDHTARIQEMHITIGHILCGLVDSMISERRRTIA
jgi:D-sedoheptulose 7-phosphate isomerase